MNPISALVLLAIILSSTLGLIRTLPVLRILLGPLIQRNMRMVEFLYRYNIPRWGHIQIIQVADKTLKDAKDTNTNANNLSANKKGLTGVLACATGPWSSSPPQSEKSSSLLYPRHEYTTDLLMRQFD